MNKFKSKQSKEIQMPVILIGAGLLALIMFLFVFVLKDSKSDDELINLGAKLKTIDDRVVQLENKVIDLEKLFNRIDRIEQTLHERLEEAEKKTVPSKQHEPASVSKPAHISKKVPVKTPKKIKKRPQYHQVTPQETLYSISRQYGLSVDQLRNLNKLAPGVAIHPGQKLRVK